MSIQLFLAVILTLEPLELVKPVKVGLSSCVELTDASFPTILRFSPRPTLPTI